MRKCIVIPARLSSTRLPKKVILDLCGKPVIQRVFEQCAKVNDVRTYIATDSQEIKTICEAFTDNIILTKKNHQSGTDRIAEAIKKINACDLVVNVQGDEPFIDPNLITDLFKALESDEIKMASAMKRISTQKELENPNIVKVITDKNKNAIYFSRAPIPFMRENNERSKNICQYENYYKHIGIYGYKKAFLLRFSNFEIGELENIEKLEQLRAIENGIKIKMIETNYFALGIDTKEDYKNAIKYYEDTKTK